MAQCVQYKHSNVFMSITKFCCRFTLVYFDLILLIQYSLTTWPSEYMYALLSDYDIVYLSIYNMHNSQVLGLHQVKCLYTAGSYLSPS